MVPSGPGPGLSSVGTLQAQLTSVQEAIAAIEGGAQSYTLAGRSVNRGSLASLYDREATLLRRISRATAGFSGRNGYSSRGRIFGLGHA